MRYLKYVILSNKINPLKPGAAFLYPLENRKKTIGFRKATPGCNGLNITYFVNLIKIVLSIRNVFFFFSQLLCLNTKTCFDRILVYSHCIVTITFKFWRFN